MLRRRMHPTMDDGRNGFLPLETTGAIHPFLRLVGYGQYERY
jgi:hypothetical protein